MSEAIRTSTVRPGAAVLAAVAALSAAPACAQEAAVVRPEAASPVFRLFNTTNPDSPASRYSTPDGALRFVFDRTYGRIALVRFEGDPEVHALRPRQGPNGDEVYTTDDGSVRLVFAPHGGITVYTNTLRTGAAAEEEGRAAPLAPVTVAFAHFQARLRQLQADAARRIGRAVSFAGPPVAQDQPVSGVVLDAAERAAEGLADAQARATVREVVIVIGPTPRAVLQGDRLIIQVAPQMGYAGRPSSTAIRNVATGHAQGPDR